MNLGLVSRKVIGLIMYAQRSDKWHHTMCRYLGLPFDTDFLYGIIPGVCREAIGRYDFMYTNVKCFDSDKTYAWSEHHANKINNGRFSNQTAYYGTAPFLWELGRVAAKGMPRAEGSLFFLPRDDQVTIREEEFDSVQKLLDEAPRPLTFLLPWRQCDIWKNWDKVKVTGDCKFIQMKDPITRQSILSEAFLKHKHIYIPWPGTDVYYAEFLDKNIIVYDRLEQYRTKVKDELEREMDLVLNYLKWGYDYLSDRQKQYFGWTKEWMDIDKQDRQYLAHKMLGLNALKSPDELYNDLLERGWLEPHVPRLPNPEYTDAYLWLKDNISDVSCTPKGEQMYALL